MAVTDNTDNDLWDAPQPDIGGGDHYYIRMTNGTPSCCYTAQDATDTAHYQPQEERTPGGQQLLDDAAEASLLQQMLHDNCADLHDGLLLLLGANGEHVSAEGAAGDRLEDVFGLTNAVAELECAANEIFGSCDLDGAEQVSEADLSSGLEDALADGVQESSFPAETRSEASRDAATRLFYCRHCPKSFAYVSRLDRHLSVHRAKQFACAFCSKHFSRRDVLDAHQRKLHADQTPVSSGHAKPKPESAPASVRCPLCPRSLASQGQLERHLAAHKRHVSGCFECAFCRKQFSDRRKLQRHERLHTTEKRFKCDACPLAFIQEAFLARHRRTHSGENPFACGDCGKAFNQEVNLRKHRERVHSSGAWATSSKAFPCGECEKRFFSLAELRNHAAYHADSRQFACSVCAAAFVERRHLDRHMRRVHSRIRNFYCNACGKTFYEKYELNYHRKVKNCHAEN